MSPVLLLCAFAFADPTESASAAPETAAPAAESSATAAESAAPAAPTRSSRKGRGRSGGKGLARQAAPAAPTLAEPIVGPMPATLIGPMPAPAPAPVFGPAPAVAAPTVEAAPATATATPAPSAPETALPTPVAPSLGDVVVTAPVPAASPAASVLDTMPSAAPVLDTMPAETGSVPASGWAWPALLSGAGLVAAWQLRKRALAAAPATLKVVQRHALGEKSSLLVVDVEDAQGVARRLLVGSGTGGLNLIQDLGLVNEAPVATPVAITPGLPIHAPVSVGTPAAPAPRAEVFASLLDEVLEERAVTPPGAAAEGKTGRYFNPEDLAPVAEVPAPEPRSSRRRAQLRGRFPTHTDDWSPQVEAYLPPPADMTPEPEPAAEPVVEPVRRGAAALLARAPTLAAPERKSGMSALVKRRIPTSADSAGPSLSVVSTASPEESTARVAIPTPSDVAVPAPIDAHRAPAAHAAPTRAVYVSPTMSQPASTAERRVVGPPLRDSRLKLPSAGPRLRLAEVGTATFSDERVPPVSELLDRLLAQQAEAPRLAVNANVTPGVAPRPEGLKGRFEAIVARETSR